MNRHSGEGRSLGCRSLLFVGNNLGPLPSRPSCRGRAIFPLRGRSFCSNPKCTFEEQKTEGLNVFYISSTQFILVIFISKKAHGSAPCILYLSFISKTKK